jgi:hypothetical protein
MINSKILSSDSSSNSDVYYDEYIQSSQTTKPQIQTFEVNKVKTFEKHVEENIMNMFEKHVGLEKDVGKNTIDLKSKVWIKESTKTMEAIKENDLDGGYDKPSNLVGSSDELNKRAEDFIARVNRHREFELMRLHNGCY